MRRPPAQRWRTVLPNQRGVLWAADCCPGPTRTVGTVSVFFIIAHARRRIEDVTVTAHPTAAWTGQQLIEATAWTHRPRSLIRDRHSVAGAKDDRRDAFVLAEALHTDRAKFTRVQPPDVTTLLLREVGRTYDALQHDRTRFSNRLRELAQEKTKGKA